MIVDQIKLLRQIQHLVLIREEESRVGSGVRQDELAQTVSQAIDGLDDEALALYKRISSKNRIFLSPLAKGNCSACGLKVPTAVMQHIIGASRFVVCTHCGRLLYLPEIKSTGVRTIQPDPKYALSRFSDMRLVVPELKAGTRDEAIAELCRLMADEHIVADYEAVRSAALAREEILTTAVGGGMAFPHMRGVEEGMLSFSIGASSKGIDWGGELVHLVVFTIMPIVASPFYLKLIAAFAKTFGEGEKLPFVVGAPDPKTMWKELNKAMRIAVRNL